MTQAFNLSQLANKVNTSGQLDASTGLVNATPIAAGGTNNGSLAVTAGGVLYTDGSKVVNVGAGTSGQALLSSGAGAPVWGSAGATGTLKNIRYFTSGSSTYTPTSGTTFVVVQVWGAGGGGAGGYTGYNQYGGSGGYAIKRITSGFSGVTLTIGSGGSGGANGVNPGSGTGNGTTGGTTSFGALVSATGGAAGLQGGGGGGVSGDLNLAGGGGGGLVPLGYGQGGGLNYGGGGAGHAYPGTGDSGGSGLAIIYEYA